MTLAGLIGPGPAVAAKPPGYDPEKKLGEYVHQLYQRALVVGKALLEAEEALIFRLEKKRTVDVKREVARFFSARRQIRSLRILAFHLEKRIPPGDPRLAKIQSLKGNIALVVQGHRKLAAKLNALAGDEIRKAAAEFEAACQEQPGEPASPTLPIRSLSDGL